MIGAKQRDVKSRDRSRMRSNAPMPPPKRATWSSFLPALLRSTCSRVTPTGATNSGVSSTPCPNESDKVPQNLFAQKELAGSDDAPRYHFRCGLRRSVGAEHETVAGAFDRAFAARRRSGRNHSLQRDQKPAGWNAGHQLKPHCQVLG